jgi:hypothetical protein
MVRRVHGKACPMQSMLLTRGMLCSSAAPPTHASPVFVVFTACLGPTNTATTHAGSQPAAAHASAGRQSTQSGRSPHCAFLLVAGLQQACVLARSQ